MIKTCSLSPFVLPSRLTLASAFGRSDLHTTNTHHTHASLKMSTDSTINGRTQQPMLASQRAKEQAQADEKPRSRGVSAYFPLGYKDAAYQWVSSTCHPPRPARDKHQLLTAFLALYSVDEHNPHGR